MYPGDCVLNRFIVYSFIFHSIFQWITVWNATPVKYKRFKVSKERRNHSIPFILYNSIYFHSFEMLYYQCKKNPCFRIFSISKLILYIFQWLIEAYSKVWSTYHHTIEYMSFFCLAINPWFCLNFSFNINKVPNYGK